MDRCQKCGCLLSASVDSGTICAKCEKEKQAAFRNTCNEPAFPVESFESPNGHFQWGFNGLTKREWFAGMALQGMLANSECVTNKQCISKNAFEFADAMIEKGSE